MTAAARHALRALAAWLVLMAVIVVGVTSGRGWVPGLLYGAATVLVPLLWAGGRPLGLDWRPDLRPWFWFAVLAAVVLPVEAVVLVVLRGAPDAGLLGRPLDLGGAALTQILLVALPEELFFRGFLQTRWAALRGTRVVRVLGTEVGWEWPAVAAAFAVVHLPTQGVSGLAVFFPGLLFGWAYARTRTIWTGTLLHASCNLVLLLVG